MISHILYGFNPESTMQTLCNKNQNIVLYLDITKNYWEQKLENVSATLLLQFR